MNFLTNKWVLLAIGIMVALWLENKYSLIAGIRAKMGASPVTK